MKCVLRIESDLIRIELQRRPCKVYPILWAGANLDYRAHHVPCAPRKHPRSTDACVSVTSGFCTPTTAYILDIRGVIVAFQHISMPFLKGSTPLLAPRCINSTVEKQTDSIF